MEESEVKNFNNPMAACYMGQLVSPHLQSQK